MTVKDLIKQLKTLPPDISVVLETEGDYTEYDNDLKTRTMHVRGDWYSTCAKTYQSKCGLCDKPEDWPLVTVVVL